MSKGRGAGRLAPAACREARALLNWTIRDLMREAAVSPGTVVGIEHGTAVRPATAAKIVAAFEAHGVEIVVDGGHARPRLRKDRVGAD